MRQQHVQLTSIPPLAQFVEAYNLVAVPVTTALSGSAQLSALVRSTRVWETVAPGVEFGLAVHVCAYPAGVMAVWVFIASLCPRMA